MSTEQLLAKFAGWGMGLYLSGENAHSREQAGISGHTVGRAGAADSVPLWTGVAALSRLYLEGQIFWLSLSWLWAPEGCEIWCLREF